MSVTHGMNVEEVRRLGRRLQEMSASIDKLRGRLDHMVSRTTWVGPTAERFQHQWWPANRAQLQRLSSDIYGLGRAAMNNAAEQERISSGGTVSGSLGAMSPRRFAGLLRQWDVVGAAQITQSIIGFREDVAAAYFATMIGMSSIGMSEAKNDATFSYFRSAKGGFTTQYRRLAGKAGIVAAGGLNALDYGMAVNENGWGSSEAAASAFEGTLSTGASLVPAGGLAFDGGLSIGDLMYKHTPLGASLEYLVVGGFENDLGSISTATDAALARGDFSEATRLNELAGQVQERVATETSGYRGLLNSALAVLKPL